jgi:hypothetical protein
MSQEASFSSDPHFPYRAAWTHLIFPLLMPIKQYLYICVPQVCLNLSFYHYLAIFLSLSLLVINLAVAGT